LVVFETLSYVDAHLHLADSRYTGQIGRMINDANENHVSRLLSNALDYETSLQTLEIAKRYNSIVLAAIGVHPWTANNRPDCQLEKFEELIKANENYVKAIGEIGLDGKYPQDRLTRGRQRDVFEFFLQVAERRSLPVIVHSRLAVDEVLQTLSTFNLPRVLLHWYNGPVQKLDLVRDRGYMISASPIVLYARRIIEIARAADLKLILTETDGPATYHGPFEGMQTRPSFVIEVVKKLAEIKSESVETVRETIVDNFRRLLGDVK
jgi:TatD DNase family protein